MKNISYRKYDNRYIGRKQINGHKIIVYGKTQKECLTNLKKELKKITLETNSQSKNFSELWDKWYLENKKTVYHKRNCKGY